MEVPPLLIFCPKKVFGFGGCSGLWRPPLYGPGRKKTFDTLLFLILGIITNRHGLRGVDFQLTKMHIAHPLNTLSLPTRTENLSGTRRWYIWFWYYGQNRVPIDDWSRSCHQRTSFACCVIITPQSITQYLLKVSQVQVLMIAVVSYCSLTAVAIIFFMLASYIRRRKCFLWDWYQLGMTLREHSFIKPIWLRETSS